MLGGVMAPASPAAAAPVCTASATYPNIVASCVNGDATSSFRVTFQCRNPPALNDYIAASPWTPTNQTITFPYRCPYGGTEDQVLVEVRASTAPPPSPPPYYYRYRSYGHGEQCNETGAAGAAAGTWSRYFCEVVVPATWSAPGLYYLWVSGPSASARRAGGNPWVPGRFAASGDRPRATTIAGVGRLPGVRDSGREVRRRQRRPLKGR
ncbi:hypothetical protein [Actinoplanes sp. NPDC049265]|uniref:hypothetical protein n=1 Tax=Actinoplanes sp. NPDC049265 TaxID=3363902 RepID=UPI0037182E23